MMNLKYFLGLTICVAILILFYSFGLNKDSESFELIKYSPGDLLDTAKLEQLVNKKKLFNLSFKYILNGQPCNQNETILAILIVTSYFGHVELRSAIRRAFSKEDLKKLGIKRVFLLGQAPNDNFTKQDAVVDESKKFNDIIQGNFFEAYRNLTYKHIMGLRWANENCHTAKYILKMDDDIVINLRRLVQLLNKIKLPKNLLAGYLLKGMKPIRQKANKWYVTEDEYQGSIYPQFVSGWFYITNPTTSRKLVTLSYFNKYFWIDDLYVTGILAEKLRIRHYDISKYFTVNPEFLECCIRDVKKHFDCDLLVGPNGGDNNLYFTFNEAIKYCFKFKCIKRLKSLNDTCVAEYKINLGRGNGMIENYKL